MKRQQERGGRHAERAELYFAVGSRVCALAVGAALAAMAWAASARADDAAAEARFRAELAAGEFAPALEQARHAATPAQRDAWLAEIARAQAEAGLPEASLRAAGEIGDDRARADTIGLVARQPLGGAGGGSGADFDSLIDLITSTVKPSTWDTVGGPGSIAGFETGVSVDSKGLLQAALREDSGGRLAALRAAGVPRAGQEDVRRNSPLRMVSLTRLEKYIQLHQALGQPPTEAMETLAGLQRIRYLFVYPGSHDLVLAGPAGDWILDPENRIVSAEGGRPVVRLDDLVVVLRHMLAAPDAYFGCLITPTQQGLARVQAFLKQSQKSAIAAESRGAWLAQLRKQLGTQDIEVEGLDPRTHAARVMVAADYRMKLVGIGLEQGVAGMESYLASIKLAPGEAPPAMGVLRWWFTLHYDAVVASKDRQAFAFQGQGVKVLSENERLSGQGQRIHTGQSDELNRRFARSFTEHFEALAAKYPVYAELRNLCDLALAATVIREEELPARLGWHLTCFGDPAGYQVELGDAPRKVESVVNCRVVNRIHILAAVSGGVAVRPAELARHDAIHVEPDGRLATQRTTAATKQLPDGAWWWDP